ncbi:MAG TPA: hypothetical protein VMS02_01780 [Solirubrobacteraceae bacterium]|nr:hypothetical protein [Solirubrobacteraceae bacterium]
MSSDDRPGPLKIADRHLAAAMIAHEYVSDPHRELVERDAADEHSRGLLRESAALTLERMPKLIRRLRPLERKWAEQKLLDPPAAEHTVERLETDLTEIMPTITELRARQDEIATELLDLVGRAS